MTRRWACLIPGEPVAKGRPRVAVVNGRARAYTPGRTASWEAFACATLAARWGKADAISAPVVLLVEAVFARPKRLMTKRTIASFAPHVLRPDGDNVLKAASDAVEKAGVIANDSQAWRAEVRKRYAQASEQPHVLIVVEWEAA